jgi:hypothetical protein
MISTAGDRYRIFYLPPRQPEKGNLRVHIRFEIWCQDLRLWAL